MSNKNENMKKNLFLLSCLVSLLAQSASAADEFNPMTKPNVVKVNLMSLGFKNFGLQYERVLAKKFSVACQVRWMPKGSVLGSAALDKAMDSDSLSIADFKIGTFAITPEFRYYPRHAGKGFYFAPYLRYRTMNLEVPIDYGTDQSVYAKGKFSSMMGGLMIGSQFNLSKSITLDWYILGFQYGTTKVDVDVTTTKTLSADDQADISNNINNFTSDFPNIKTTVGSNGGAITGTLEALGFRGFGLSLGYKF